jgi:hypothetical protein
MISYPPHLGSNFEVKTIDTERKIVQIVTNAKRVEVPYQGRTALFGGFLCLYNLRFSDFWSKGTKNKMAYARRMERQGKAHRIREFKRFGVKTADELENVFNVSVVAALRNKRW